VSEVAAEVRTRAAKYLSAKAKVHPSHDRFVAAQAAAIELLVERGGPLAEPARLMFPTSVSRSREETARFATP
jgi:hypothetical protein